jgi:hypothetical protein
MKDEVNAEGMKDEVKAVQPSLHPYSHHFTHSRHFLTALTSSFILHPFIRRPGAD